MYSLALIAIASFMLTLILTPVVRDWTSYFGWVDRPDFNRKIHTKPIPRTGGIVIAAAYLGAIGILAVVHLSGWRILQFERAALWSILAGALIVFFTGFLDDRKSLSPKFKILMHMAAGAIAFTGGLRIHAAHHLSPTSPAEWWWSLPLTIFWLVLCTNAFNLIDGMDGLASGIGLFATLTLICAAFLQHNFPLLFALVPLAGALLGFLRYNFNPASIFLGDCGSYTIGFLLGCFALLWSQKSATLLGLMVPVVAFAVPLFDLALAVARRFLRGEPIFSPDRLHLHHRLLDRGLTPRRAVLVLYAAATVVAGLSLLSTIPQRRMAGLVLVSLCGSAWFCIQTLGYREIDAAGQIVFRFANQLFFHRAFRSTIKSELLIRSARDTLRIAKTPAEYWQCLRIAAREMGMSSATLFMNGQRFSELFVAADSRAAWTLEIPLESECPGRIQLTMSMDRTLPHATLEKFLEIFQPRGSLLSSISPRPVKSAFGNSPMIAAGFDSN